MKTTKEQKLIRQYNEEFHFASDLEGADLYSLDESEVEDFEKWVKTYKTHKIEGISLIEIEPKKLKKGMLVLWGNQLLHINGKQDGMYLLGTNNTNEGLEPAFYPDNKTRVFQPVEIINLP